MNWNESCDRCVNELFDAMHPQTNIRVFLMALIAILQRALCSAGFNNASAALALELHEVIGLTGITVDGSEALSSAMRLEARVTDKYAPNIRVMAVGAMVVAVFAFMTDSRADIETAVRAALDRCADAVRVRDVVANTPAGNA